MKVFFIFNYIVPLSKQIINASSIKFLCFKSKRNISMKFCKTLHN